MILKEISDYLDLKKEELERNGESLANFTLHIKGSYFESLPKDQPSNINDTTKKIYGVSYKIIDDLERDFVLVKKWN